MIVFTAACIIIAIFLRYWRFINTIKTDKKITGKWLCILSIIITTLHLVTCISEEVFISFSNLSNSLEYYVAYSTFSYLEIILIIKMMIWNTLKNRIITGLDGPVPVQVIPPPMPYPYGAQVIIIPQPNNAVMMPNQNQGNTILSNENKDITPYPQENVNSNEYPIQNNKPSL